MKRFIKSVVKFTARFFIRLFLKLDHRLIRKLGILSFEIADKISRSRGPLILDERVTTFPWKKYINPLDWVGFNAKRYGIYEFRELYFLIIVL